MPCEPDSEVLAAEIRRRLGPPPELPQWPLVSIVVLNRDGAVHLQRLLPGLIERTDYPNLELILVDNASGDDSLDYIRTVAAPFPISILANRHNESFSDANNQGAGLASGELLLFLNNDAEPFEQGWLRELVACLRRSGAAAVGPALLQPAAGAAGRAGCLVHQRGLRLREQAGSLVTAYRDHLADPLGEWLGEDVETVALAAACLLAGREAFERVGGFTHGYWYGPEDVDLGLKLLEWGMRMRCSGRSLLIHPPNSTLNTVEDERRGAWVRGNRRLFWERWGPRVRREYELDRLAGGDLWAEPDPAAGGGKAGEGGAGSTRLELEALAYCFKVAGDSAASDPGLSERLAELRAALLRRGHRCLVARGEAVEDLECLDYDVAVHLHSQIRNVPKPAQLDVLWLAGESDPPPALECRHYQLIVCGPGEPARRLAQQASRLPPVAVLEEADAVLGHGSGSPPAPASIERFLDGLAATIEERARDIGMRTRIGPV